MHEIGIAHLDLNGRNILIPDSKPDDFVFIDFETAHDDFDGSCDLSDAVKSMVTYKDDKTALHHFCRVNEIATKEWLYPFDDADTIANPV